MSISDYVTANAVITNASSPTIPGLNTGLIAAFHNVYPDRVRIYPTATMLAQMVTDGFSTASPAYKAATAYCAAPAAPALCCIGRRALPPYQSLTLTCADGTVNDKYNFTLVDSLGASHAFAYTNVAAQGTATSLTGNVSVTNGSTAITFASAQTLPAGTTLTFASQPGIFYTLSLGLVAATAGVLTTAYTGPTNAATAPSKWILTGTATVTNGSTAVTFASSQTLGQGDLLVFSSQPGVYYPLASAVSSTSGTLSIPYAGTSSTTALVGHVATMSVTFDTVYGSASVVTSATPVGQVHAGDSVVFASQPTVSYTVAQVGATLIAGSPGIILTTVYTGSGAAADYCTDVCTTTVAATNLTSQIQAISGYAGIIGTVTSSGAVITIARTDGNLTDVQGWVNNGFSSIQLADNTADPGIATDLAAIQAANGGAWYGLILDSNSAAEIKAAAAYIEATGVGGKVFFSNNSDYGNTQTATTTDVFTVLHGLTYKRSFVQHNSQQLLSYGGASICSYALSQYAGSYTLGYKSEPGVPADSDTTLPEGQALCINSMTASNPGPGGKYGNYYKTVAGQNWLTPGCAPSGQFMDLTIGIDFLVVNMQANVAAVLAGLPKVPFDDFGLQLVGAAVLNILTLMSGAPYNFILPNGQDPNRPLVVNVPKASSLTSTQRATRDTSGITYSAGLQGAIQNAAITGQLIP